MNIQTFFTTKTCIANQPELYITVYTLAIYTRIFKN